MNSQIQREQFRNFCLTHRWIVVLLLYKWLFSRSSVLHRCLFPHKSWIISSVEWERKTRLSTTLRKIQELRGEKKHMRQHGVVSCNTPGNAGDYFYWKAMKSKYYHYRTSPGLFSSFHYYCTASSAIVFVNTIGRTLQPVGDSVNWDLPCECWCFLESSVLAAWEEPAIQNDILFCVLWLVLQQSLKV